MGSWKIIAMSLPTILRLSARDMVSMSLPSNIIRSAVTVALGGSRPISASISTDLPEPDSPTMASTSREST